jgi:hypothetical protein
MFRTLALVLTVLALVCFVTPAMADTAEGTVVKCDGKTLTIKDKDNKEHSCEIATDAKVTLDGKEGKLADRPI